MRPITVSLDSSIRSLELHVLSDWHIGDLKCNYPRIKEEVEHIWNTPNAYAILAGDLCDNATTHSIGDTYSANLSPMEQISQVCKILGPLAEQGKCLCATTGNHCERTYRSDGIDMTRLICRQLGIEDHYREEFCYLFLSFGTKSDRASAGRKMTYTVYVNHGSGGGRKIGGKANRLSDLSTICDADVYVIGHTHQPLVFKDGFYRATNCSKGLEYVERTYVNTAAMLEYGGYGARQQFRPASNSNPVIFLDGTRRNIEVTL